MGELSKRIGEIGEEIVEEFLGLIGWHPLVKNIDIPSPSPESHGKHTHGVDAYFHYQSPVISRTLENVLVSVKYSKEKYPNSPAEKFKSHYRDLGMAIESFKKSDIRMKNINSRSEIETVFDRGIIFWLNNIEDDDSVNLIEKLARIETPKDFIHDGIFLIDNQKLAFFYSAIQYVKRKFQSQEIKFTYFNTGLNGDNQSPKNGLVMPIQYFASNILPLRIENQENKNCLILCTRERFEEDELIKLIGLAKNITANFQSNTIISFPDYNRVLHEQIVNNAKSIFEEPSFTSSITIENFNDNFRN